MTELPSKPRGYSPPKSGLERAVCRALFRFMLGSNRIQFEFGDTDPERFEQHDSEFVVAPPTLWVAIKLMLFPTLWVGESYVAGNWYLIKGNLSEFLNAVYGGAKPTFRSYFDFISHLRGFRYYVGQYLLNRYYTRKVKRHYEVDSKIYEMILDDEMLYTCAFFSSETDTLPTAQQRKLTAIMERMSLPNEAAHILDIGCGWGGLARAVTKQYDDKYVCGLSISNGQIAWAKQKDATSLTDQQRSRIEYRLEDYLNHHKTEFYDAISVIGMIEHVGLGGYDSFFQKLNSFLKLGATAVIHTIVSPLPATPTNSWIDRHIFTGGYTPSISELVEAAERNQFRVSGLYVYPPVHYRRTIEAWLSNFLKNGERICAYLKAENYSDDKIERFVRTWIFYLSGVRTMFVEDSAQSHQVVQFAIKKL